MDKARVRQYLIDFQAKDIPPCRQRNMRLADSARIQTIIGARRVGKTYLFYNKMKELEERGVPRTHMLYLNFESPTFADVSYKEWKDILEVHWSLFPESIKKPVYLFVDEPQAIPQWELAVRELHDLHQASLFITGSSSRLLSKEIATALRGRAATNLLFPLSFPEYCSFKQFPVQPAKITSEQKALLQHYLEDYISHGSFPEVVLEPNNTEKVRILKDYFDMTIYKDLIERYKVTNTTLVKWLMNALTNSLSREVSMHKLYQTLKSEGIRIGKNTLYEYASMLEDSFYCFFLRKHSFSKKQSGTSIPKLYLNDVGFLNLFSLQDYGSRMENAVFLHLQRKKHIRPLLDFTYYKTPDGKEVDFIINEGKAVKTAIQVCMTLKDSATRERETGPLIRALDSFKLPHGYIITKEEEDTINIEGKTIHVIPLWKYLLDEANAE